MVSWRRSRILIQRILALIKLKNYHTAAFTFWAKAQQKRLRKMCCYSANFPPSRLCKSRKFFGLECRQDYSRAIYDEDLCLRREFLCTSVCRGSKGDAVNFLIITPKGNTPREDSSHYRSLVFKNTPSHAHTYKPLRNQIHVISARYFVMANEARTWPRYYSFKHTLA
jgi:hypothetical protein